MTARRLLAIVAVVVGLIALAAAWPWAPTASTALALGDSAVPGQIRRYPAELVPPVGKPVHPGPRAEPLVVAGAWDVAMAAGPAPDFFDLPERERRALRGPDLEAWVQAFVAEHGEPTYPTMERRVSGEVRLRLRGEDYCILHGRAMADGVPQEGMIVVLVRRPAGWLMSTDLSGSEAIAGALAALTGAAVPGASAPIDRDLADRPWPRDGEALIAEAVALRQADHWLATVALNRLAQPAHLPALETALARSGEAGAEATRLDVVVKAILRLNAAAALHALARQAERVQMHAEQILPQVGSASLGAELLPTLEALSREPADRHLHGAFTRALARIGDGPVWARLLQRAQTGELDEQQREAFADGLCTTVVRRDDPEGIEVLTRTVAWWGEPELTTAALRQLGGEQGGEAMLAALLQANLPERKGQLPVLDQVLAFAVPGVRGVRPGLVAELLPHLGAEQAQVRWLAAELLLACDEPDARATVAARAASEPVEPVRRRLLALAAAKAAP